MFTVLRPALSQATYSNASELIISNPIEEWPGNRSDLISKLQDWKKTARSFEGIAAPAAESDFVWRGRAEPLGANCYGGYFFLLRMNPSMGRTFTRDETASAGSNAVAVLTMGWKRRYGLAGTSSARTIHLNGAHSPYRCFITCFQGISQKAEVWVPITMIGIVSTPLLLATGAQFGDRSWAIEFRDFVASAQQEMM